MHGHCSDLSGFFLLLLSSFRLTPPFFETLDHVLVHFPFQRPSDGHFQSGVRVPESFDSSTTGSEIPSSKCSVLPLFPCLYHPVAVHMLSQKPMIAMEAPHSLKSFVVLWIYFPYAVVGTAVSCVRLHLADEIHPRDTSNTSLHIQNSDGFGGTVLHT